LRRNRGGPGACRLKIEAFLERCPTPHSGFQEAFLGSIDLRQELSRPESAQTNFFAGEVLALRRLQESQPALFRFQQVATIAPQDAFLELSFGAVGELRKALPADAQVLLERLVIALGVEANHHGEVVL
jgi:hypothetical protein